MPDATADDRAVDWAAIGRAVYLRRVELGMSNQQALADRAGVHLNTVSRIERGTPSTRRSPTWPKIEAALDWAAGHIEHLADGSPTDAAPPIGEDLVEDIAQAVRDAVAVVEPDVTVRQAREIAEAAIAALRRRKLLPPPSSDS